MEQAVVWYVVAIEFGLFGRERHNLPNPNPFSRYACFCFFLIVGYFVCLYIYIYTPLSGYFLFVKIGSAFLLFVYGVCLRVLACSLKKQHSISSG